MQNARTIKILIVSFCTLLFIACDLLYSPPGVLQSSRQAGTYLQPIAITLSSNHSKAIHYTTDGSLPTLDSPRYTTPITLTKTTQVQAIAIDSSDKVVQRKSWNYIVRGTPHFSPTLSVVDRRLYHVSDQYEYSTDDGNNWQACTGLSQSLPSLSVGNTVHVRHKLVQDDRFFLGEILGSDGPDLVAGNCYVTHARLHEGVIDDFSALIFDADIRDGNATIAIPTITNRGNAAFSGSVFLDFYASSDPYITEEDVLFLSMETIDFTLGPNQTYGASQDGSWPTDVIWLLGLIKTVEGVPQLTYQVSTLEGFQYIGYHLRTEESELLTQNNWTASQYVDSVFFTESDADTTDGAFKIVNSWGEGNWEHIPDGAYYLPLDAAVALKLKIYYSLNTSQTVYEPFLLASFDVAHENRETCLISIGVGEPSHPLMVKRLQSVSDIKNDAPVLAGGPNPFPDTKMILDISEFAPYIATNDIFIRIDNRMGTETATLSSFSVELYDDYSLDPADAAQILGFPLEGSSPTVAAGENKTFLISTSRDLDPSHLPLLRTQSRSRTMAQSLPAQRSLSEEEIQSILALQAPASRSRSQSNASLGGLVPPTEAELRSMRTLDVGTRWYPGDLPSEVDWTQSPYFPPIGNQGAKGSCAAFTNAYYIHTYNEAREHGWDLSGAQWVKSTTGSGYPSVEYQDKIMSPDFSYHLVSQAPGASIAALQSVLNRIGSSTWKTTGYDEYPDERLERYEYPWPTEEAFREAAQYRGRLSDGSYFEENSGGLIVLDDPAKIDIVQQLLASGYCLATGIDAISFFGTEDPWMNGEDVVDLTGVAQEDIANFSKNINHAQTIVGYKAGSAWSP
ncbi:MAG: chitobiase/beta-hexosaminidase C-terminal domain-containing protein [Sphaerochaeta sp.]|nr:chitobiase/beta-hexosaminidase C-terminal domain-containing protein [Sphaerochaeta sp.]